MRATMTGAAFNRMAAALKPFVSQRIDHHSSLFQVYFHRETCSAEGYALDGYHIVKQTIPCMDVDEDFTALLRPLPMKPRKDDLIEIKRKENVSYVSFGWAQFATEHPDGEIFNAPGYIQGQQARTDLHRVAVNPQYLMDAVKSIQAVRNKKLRIPLVIEFGDPVYPIILRENESDDLRIVLPVRIKDQ